MVAGSRVLTVRPVIAGLGIVVSGTVATVAHGDEHHDANDDDRGRERGQRQEQRVIGEDGQPCGTGCLGPGSVDVSASVNDSRALIRPAPQVNTAIRTSVQNSTTSPATLNNHDG